MRFKFYTADDIKEDYDQLPGSSELNFKADFLWILPKVSFHLKMHPLGWSPWDCFLDDFLMVKKNEEGIMVEIVKKGKLKI